MITPIELQTYMSAVLFIRSDPTLTSTTLAYYYLPFISVSVSFVLTLLLILNKSSTIQDIPNERSLHATPIPRTGGIALMIGILSGWILLIQFWMWWIVLPVLGLFILSLLDDVHNLSPQSRLIGHLIAALIAVFGAGTPLLWFIPVLLFIIWMTNLYNFMDGSDGLAGGMALFGFACYGIGAWMSENEVFALLNFSVAASALGFLFYNFHPARVFMGDSGSIPLGFMAASFGIWGWLAGYWPFWFPLLTFSPFVTDTTITLLKRAQRGERLSQAHRSHYYQRLVQMGWGHRNTALAEYALMLMTCVSALLGIGLSIQGQIYLLVWWCVIYLGLLIWIDWSWRLHQANQENINVA